MAARLLGGDERRQNGSTERRWRLQSPTLEQAKEKAEAADGGAEKKEEVKAPEDPAKKLKKVIKEGGKRGVEIEGAADMGGLKFFCTSMDEPDGDLDMLCESMTAMNAKSDPTEEERKGGSGHVGKMIFSAGTDQLAVMAWVPEDSQGVCKVEEWVAKVLSLFKGKIAKGPAELGAGLCSGYVAADGNNNIFPLKIREPMLLEANNFLRKLGLFPEDNEDSDEMVFGDDDFPS